jgi:hypothetical protein
VAQFLAGAVLLLLSLAVPVPLGAQSAPVADKPNHEFFSGVITVLADEQITVSKNVPGKNSEARVFLIAKETRVEGKLRLKARVTVRYTHSDSGDHAVHIIVRAAQKK